MDGKGILKSRNGRIYDGAFKKGKRCGYGIMTWRDGRSYEGEWKDDKQWGRGNMWEKTPGIWERGKLVK